MNLQIKGRFKIKQYEAGTRNLITESDWNNNLVVTSTGNGINRILKAILSGGQDIEITKGMIGTGDTAPTVNDTALESPLAYDVEIAQRTEVSNTTILIEFFIPNAFLPNDTYTEFGAFTGDSLFSRALIDTPLEKDGNIDVAVEYEYSLTNSGS